MPAPRTIRRKPRVDTGPALPPIRMTSPAAARAFDAYLMVDWSSRSEPATGKDSIWIASGAWSGDLFSARPLRNLATRVDAAREIRRQALGWCDQALRVLVGFDFAFGYPAGFARALGLDVRGSGWKAVHDHFAREVTDSPRNAHNRDAFADRCNVRIGAPGPFWGCHAAAASPSLPQRRVGSFDFPHRGLEEWRVTDLAVRARAQPQSVWKLNCGVSVGGQTILGIKHLDDLAHALGGHVWPFDGWTPPQAPAVSFAEIFPSLISYREWEDEVHVPDAAQVQSCLRFAAERDARGELRRDLEPPSSLDAATLARVETEEGWILWAPREDPRS